jgi:hypothetical protein
MKAHCNEHIASEREEKYSNSSQVHNIEIRNKKSYNRRNVTIEYNPVLQRARLINEDFNLNASSAQFLSREKVINLV